jgi:hypothetical protein
MKPLSLVLGFLPVIAFSLLARLLPAGDFGLAALISAAIAGIVMAVTRPPWPPKILTAGSLAVFIVLALVGFAVRGDDSWLHTWGGSGVGIVLGVLILVLIPVMPFTEQYARETTPQQYWGSPTFKRINLVLSVAWGVASIGVGICRVAAELIVKHTTAQHLVTQLVLGAAVPLAILIFMLKFSKSYPERVTHHHEADPA